VRLVLTLSCPDRVGVVAAVSGFLAERGCFITESNHYGDPDTARFFMRTVFELAPSLEEGHWREEFALVARGLDMAWKVHDVAARARTLVLVSGFEHCLSDLLYRVRLGRLPIEVVAAVSNHEKLRTLVEWHGIPYLHLPVDATTKAQTEQRIIDLIEQESVELVVLARYMQILSNDFCRRYPGLIINIHHSFLPSFKGARPYHQAHARGVKLIGATAHYVTADLDEGPIIEQAVERVTHDATIEDLVALGCDIESAVLARAVRYHVEHRVLLNGNKTVIFG
jgi:formyltetrahydrofolate deformylase